MKTKRLLWAGLTLVATLVAKNAGAVSLIDSSAGIKLLPGADIWTAPSNTNGYQGLGFAGSAGGFSYGALGYYELRIIKYLGVEAGFAYQHGSFYRNVTINGLVELKETIDIDSLRLPILAKLNLPLTLGRLWFGAGPEFTLYQTSSAKIEQTGGPTATLVGNMQTKDVNPVFATMGLGLVIEVPTIGIDIPVELRASKNLSQPSDFLDRVTVDPTAGNVIVQAESSWVLRLGVGIGYRF